MVLTSNNLPSTKGALQKEPGRDLYWAATARARTSVLAAFTTYIIRFNPSQHLCLTGLIYPMFRGRG